MEPQDSVDDTVSGTWMLIYSAVALLVVMGIPGPMPIPLVGNYFSFDSGGGRIQSLKKWSKKYGNNYGAFLGDLKMLWIGDADLARQILIKDFPNFNSRDKGVSLWNMRYLRDSVLSLKGDRWKLARSYMSPAFSGSKMKLMIPYINSKCDILLKNLEQKHKDGQTFEAKLTFGRYVLDNIACCAFGFDADCQRNPNDLFLKKSREIFTGRGVTGSSVASLIRAIVPSVGPVLDFLGYERLNRDAMDFFADVVRKAVELRKENDERKDFLQLMVDAVESGGGNEEEDGGKPRNTEGGGRVKQKLPITQDELIGQCIIFFFAGFETVSTQLSFAAYALAAYPEIQKKVQDEIDDLIPDGQPVSYDDVFKMEYLDKVWNESLRMWPSAPWLQRICNEDITYHGIRIPAGEFIAVNLFAIQHDEDYWPQPWTFNPENFSKEASESRHPCAFLGFGAGPRNCVGMRFAILESKICLIRILQKYNLKTKTPDLCNATNLGIKTIYPHQTGI